LLLVGGATIVSVVGVRQVSTVRRDTQVWCDTPENAKIAGSRPGNSINVVQNILYLH
jgi:hypothetical protein